LVKSKLDKSTTLLTILSVIALVVLSPATNSWASEILSTRGNNSENQSRSDTNVNNDFKTLNDDKDSSENKSESKRAINPFKNLHTIEKPNLSIIIKSVKVEGQPVFTVKIDGENPTPSEFDFTPADRNIGLKSHEIELDPGKYDIEVYPKGLGSDFPGSDNHPPYDIRDSHFDCRGSISFGEHRTCEISIEDWPRLMIYTHSVPEGIKATDFVIGVMKNNKVVDEFAGKEDGERENMMWGDQYHVYVKDNKGLSVQYSNSSNLQNSDPYWCTGTIKHDDGPSFTKVNCYIVIDLSQLKVIVKEQGGSTPVGTFKYKIKSDDISVNGKEYNGNLQGTVIPIRPGASYDVQPLDYNNYIPTKFGECDNQGESGKVKLCTLTFNAEQENCNIKINEQGKPEKVC